MILSVKIRVVEETKERETWKQAERILSRSHFYEIASCDIPAPEPTNRLLRRRHAAQVRRDRRSGSVVDHARRREQSLLRKSSDRSARKAASDAKDGRGHRGGR
jgi:hypothetical protein